MVQATVKPMTLSLLNRLHSYVFRSVKSMKRARQKASAYIRRETAGCANREGDVHEVEDPGLCILNPRCSVSARRA